MVEGLDDFKALWESGKRVEEVFHCKKLISQGYVSESLAKWERKELTSRRFPKKPSSRLLIGKKSDGILAVVRKWSLEIRPPEEVKHTLVVVLDEIEKPGNLGAILRTAEAFGADAVFLSDSCVDFFNPNVVRSSRD